MISFVPENSPEAGTHDPFPELSDLLDGALESLGAESGWIGIVDASGRLSFSVRGGVVSDRWLTWPSTGGIWGFAVGDEPAFLNALHPLLTKGEPSLSTLLSCPLRHDKQIIGHVVVANKPHAFTDRDAAVLQGLAHPLARLLGRRLAQPRAPLELSAAWRRILNRADEAIVLLEDGGVLRYANAAWLEWTGFRAEELLGQTPPFPFWVRPQDLARLETPSPIGCEQAVPFRHRNQTLFWCRLETENQRWGDHLITVAFLQRLSSPTCASEGSAEETPPPPSLRPPEPEWLPLLIEMNGGIDGWGPRWQQLTGLAAREVEGSRGELVLDWLFPQQRDRERVADCLHHPHSSSCQIVLEITTATGSQRVLCTFLPCPVGEPPTATRRWLLLVGSVEAPSSADIAGVDPSRSQSS